MTTQNIRLVTTPKEHDLWLSVYEHVDLWQGYNDYDLSRARAYKRARAQRDDMFLFYMVGAPRCVAFLPHDGFPAKGYGYALREDIQSIDINLWAPEAADGRYAKVTNQGLLLSLLRPRLELS